MTFPHPVISVAIEPKTKGDQDKLGQGLQRLSEEDPTFRVQSDDETGQTLISGMGELHLEIIVDRLMREFNVDANVGRPQVAYRETVGKRVEKVEGRFVRQTGGRVEGLEPRGNAQAIKARVPLATMFGYATDLRSMSQGRATFTMQFDRYEEAPQSIASEIVAAAQGS